MTVFTTIIHLKTEHLILILMYFLVIFCISFLIVNSHKFCSLLINAHLTFRPQAAGLGHMEIAREILELYPAAVLAQDNDGKTPLHYAAAVKDDGLMYNLLVEFGADEGKLDNVSKFIYWSRDLHGPWP